MTRRLFAPLLAPLLVAVLALGGCSTTQDDSDEPVLTGSELALHEELAPIDGVTEVEVTSDVGRVAVALTVDPAATDSASLADAVLDAVADSDFSRAAVHLTFTTNADAEFEWNGYDPAHHDRYLVAFDLWWRALDIAAGIVPHDALVAREWFGMQLDIDAQALIAGESIVAPLAAIRAEATAAGLTVLESRFAAHLPFNDDRAFDLEPEALYHAPPKIEDMMDDVEAPGFSTFLVGVKMNLAVENTDPNDVPVEIYMIPNELPGGGYPPFDAALAQAGLDALNVKSVTDATTGITGGRIEAIYLLTDTGLVRVDTL